MSKKIFVDENAMRLFSDASWFRLREELEKLGFEFIQIPAYMRGASDQKIVETIINRGYDGIITEDNDFVETNRWPLFRELMNAGKEIYLVRRVPSNSSRYEIRVYKYEHGRKKFFIKIKPDGTVSTNEFY